MSTIQTNTITDAAGTGAPDFPNGINAATALVAKVDDTERMRIDSSGNLGLGTGSPAAEARLNVTGGRTYLDAPNAFTLRLLNSGTAGGFIGTSAADTLNFYDSTGTERVRIDGSGNLGLGTSSPGAKFDSYTTTNGPNGWYLAGQFGAPQYPMVRLHAATPGKYSSLGNNGDGSLYFYVNGSSSDIGTESAVIDASGNFMIGTNSAIYGQKFSVSESGTNTNAGVFRHSGANPYGPYIEFSTATPNVSTRYFLSCVDATAERATIRSNGGIANYSANNVNLSDERVKTDVAPLGSYWDKIKALQVVTYKYLDQTHDDDNIGVIAQQVESVAPEFVSNDGFGKTPEDGIPLKTIYEADLHYATLKALQEAMARIEALEAQLNP